MTRCFLIPKNHGAADFDHLRSDAMDLLVAWQSRFGRSFVFSGRETPSDHAEEWLFLDAATGSTFHLVCDQQQPPLDTDVCYAALSGAPSVIDPLASAARASPLFHDHASIAASAAQGFESTPNLLLLMALAGLGTDPCAEADTALHAALDHPDAVVRYVAVFAIQQAGWDRYKEQLQGVESHDDDENVRILARETTRRLQE